jgi:hypothetical protein
VASVGRPRSVANLTTVWSIRRSSPGGAEQGGAAAWVTDAGGVGLRRVDDILGGPDLPGVAALQHVAQRMEVGPDASGGGFRCRRPPRLADIIGEPGHAAGVVIDTGQHPQRALVAPATFADPQAPIWLVGATGIEPLTSVGRTAGGAPAESI